MIFDSLGGSSAWFTFIVSFFIMQWNHFACVVSPEAITRNDRPSHVHRCPFTEQTSRNGLVLRSDIQSLEDHQFRKREREREKGFVLLFDSVFVAVILWLAFDWMPKEEGRLIYSCRSWCGDSNVSSQCLLKWKRQPLSLTYLRWVSCRYPFHDEERNTRNQWDENTQRRRKTMTELMQ